MTSIAIAIMRHSYQSYVMFVMPIVFSTMKSIIPIIILWRPKIRIVPMEIRVMIRLLMLFSERLR